MLSVIIPANNEARWLPGCLEALLAQTLDPAVCGGVEIIVAANACTDDTVPIARARADRFAARGYGLRVLDLPQGGKPGALNRADAEASGTMRAYLDADVALGPDMLAAIVAVLAVDAPRYASGRLQVAPAQSWVTRQVARVWVRLPFMAEGVPGAGFFAVNAAGRARWGGFPQIISDDTYVRLLFTPDERIAVPVPYSWPMVEGFAALVRVRRRQDLGVAEVAALYPDLMKNEAKAPLTAAVFLRLAVRMPVSLAVYVLVLIAVRIGSDRTGSAAALPGQTTTAHWSRGR